MLLLGCLAGLGFSLSGLFTARRKRPARPQAARERSLHDLRAGDIVQHGSTFLVVRRALQLAAAGRWRTLSELEAEGAASGPLLLWGAEAAGEAEAAWLLHPLPATRADLLSTPHAPATEWLPHEGLRYRLHSRHHTAVRVATAAATAGDPGRACRSCATAAPAPTACSSPAGRTSRAPASTPASASLAKP